MPKLSSSAFTLVELIVVVTVLMIIVAAVTPNLISMRATSELRDFRAGVRRLAPEARERAIRSGASTQIVYDESATELRIERANQVDDAGAPLVRVRIVGDNAPQRYMVEGRDSSASDFRLIFTPDGRSTGGGLEFPGFSFFVDQSGAARWIEGPLPEPQDERWQAGDIEQRI